MNLNKWNNIKKLGLCIIAFEGTEHLANIITELRDVFDYVSIGLQRVSYYGDNIATEDLNEIFRLRDEDKLVDKILEVSLDTSKPPRELETIKRNTLVQDAEDAGCSHVLIIDSDEYYNKSGVLKALQEIDENDYEITYCLYINYFYDYQHTMLYPFKKGMYVPFVSKVKYRFSFDCKDFEKPSDPTRRYVRPFDGYKIITINNLKYKVKNYTVDYHIFPWKMVKMHHLSMLRANIRKKFNNWSSKSVFNNYYDLIDKAVYKYDNFDINKDEQRISLLFGTPNNEVIVKKLPKQYIQPKFDFRTRLRPAKQYKQILVLNMSSKNSDCDLYNTLDKCNRETWAKDIFDNKYSNIDYYTMMETDDISKIDIKYEFENTHNVYYQLKLVDNTIDINNESKTQIVERFLDAYKLITELSGKKYDYIIRTNGSTWINLEILNEFIAILNNDSHIYSNGLNAAYYSLFSPFFSGSCIILPTRYMPIIKTLYELLSDSVKYIMNDDVIISMLLRKRYNILNKILDNSGWKLFNSLEGLLLYDHYRNTDFDNLNFECPIFLIKDFLANNDKERLENDIIKMQRVNKEWLKHKDEYNIEHLSKTLFNHCNKTIRCIFKTKLEWITLTEYDRKLYFCNDSVQPLNDETINICREFAIKQYGKFE